MSSNADRSGLLIDESVVESVLGVALRTGGEFAEVFAEDRRAGAARLDDGRVEDLASGRERGAGIRVVVGETTGFAHTSDLSETGLRAAAEAAAAAARQGGGGVRTVALRAVTAPAPNEVTILPERVAKAEKVELLRRADEAARSAGGAVRQVSAVYARQSAPGHGGQQRRGPGSRRPGQDPVRGVMRGERRHRHADRTRVGRGDGGLRVVRSPDVEDLARAAAGRALTKLAARPAPSGRVPVVIKQGSGGVLFHEACGHGLEADHIAKDVSVFTGRIGQQVASPLVTLVDDGTMGPEWGALAIDDEGHPAGRNVLIENGVLTDYMWDWLRARKEGRSSSGNGRRESYQHLPMVRMTNTYVLAGTEDPEEIVRQTPHGVYVAQLGGGQVNPATGDFVFGMTEAYLIEDGRITEPLRDANLIGNGPEVLRLIDAVGNDFAMGPPGTCGKQGQGVPVGDGQPTLRVSALTVGGTAR